MGGGSEIAPLVEYLPCRREKLNLMTRIHVKSREWWHAFVISALGTSGSHQAPWPPDPPDWQVHNERPCLKNKMTSRKASHLSRHLASGIHTHTWIDMCTHTHTSMYPHTHKHTYNTYAYVERVSLTPTDWFMPCKQSSFVKGTEQTHSANNDISV